MEHHMTRLRTLARVLDDALRIPGTRIRFGLDPLLGLFPGAGDAVTGAVATYAIVVAAKLGAPPSVILRMALNILVDVVLGAIPLLGDLFDLGWKSNRKNVRLLERYEAEPKKVRAASWVVVGLVILLLIGALVGVFVLVRALLRAIF